MDVCVLKCWNNPLIWTERDFNVCFYTLTKSCFTLIALYWSIKMTLSKINRWILSAAGVPQTLSSNIVSAVYIQCQSQRTPPKENWHSEWLSWCCLKPHPGVCSNPQCAPRTILLQQITSSVAYAAVYPHWLWLKHIYCRCPSTVLFPRGNGRERQAEGKDREGDQGLRVGGREGGRRDRVIHGLITVGNVRVPIQRNDEGLCGGGLWEPTKTALVSLAECICIA